jgi:hypothetical protein
LEPQEGVEREELVGEGAGELSTRCSVRRLSVARGTGLERPSPERHSSGTRAPSWVQVTPVRLVQMGTEVARAATAHPGEEVRQRCPVGVRLQRGYAEQHGAARLCGATWFVVRGFNLAALRGRVHPRRARPGQVHPRHRHAARHGRARLRRRPGRLPPRLLRLICDCQGRRRSPSPSPGLRPRSSSPETVM